MKNKINIALQILPSSKDKDIYGLVDKAIEVIQRSGVKYKVCPFETVMEGDYDQLMQIVKEAQEAVLEAGGDSTLTYVKIQRSKNKDVFIEDKMKKYE